MKTLDKLIQEINFKDLSKKVQHYDSRFSQDDLYNYVNDMVTRNTQSNTPQVDERLYYTPKQRKIVKEGNLDGYVWKITSNGAYPCLYITLAQGHPLHYCTDVYASNGTGISGWIETPLKYVTYWDNGTLGFDFADYNDFIYGDYSHQNGKKWTVEELEDMVKQCVQDLHKANNEETANWLYKQLYDDYDDDYDYDDYYYDDEYDDYDNESQMNENKKMKTSFKKIIRESIARVINEGKESTASANRMIKILYKGVNDLTAHLYRDTDWYNIDNVFERIENIIGSEGELFVWCENGGYVKDREGKPIYKEWKLRIELSNGGMIGGSVKANAAGSVKDPLDAYDITCTFWRE